MLNLTYFLLNTFLKKCNCDLQNGFILPILWVYLLPWPPPPPQKKKSKFVRTVHTNFHAKFGLCSSRNERVMLNLAIWWPFCFLAAILFLKILSKLVQTVHTNFHAKSGVCSSKNGWVIALGTKEDTYSSIIIYLQVIIQSKLFCSQFASLDNNCSRKL